MKKNIDFYYFSGTGNTMLVARKMTEIFQEEGYIVNLEKMEISESSEVNTEHTIGLGFPVAILSTYNLVWNFIQSLPEVQGTEIFMVDTMGGYSGGLVGPLRAILERKGYQPIGACEIIMPVNIFYIQNDKTNREKVKKGLEIAEKYAKALIDGRSRWGRVPFFSDALNIFSKAGIKLTTIDLHQKYFKFRTNEVLCNKCGICAEICPVGNIMFDEYPVSGNKCEYCMRCVSMCPIGAIRSLFTYNGKTYSAVKAKDFIKTDF
jgi:NAD-dependent dihydropyrimidine dehydrogenase PreA subunit